MEEDEFSILDDLIFKHSEANLACKIAIVVEGKTLSYGELALYIRTFASALLLRKHISEGDVVACIMDDSIESIVCFFGLIYNGMVPCCINPHMPISAYSFYLSHIKAKYVLLSKTLEDTLSKPIRDLNLKFEVIEENFFVGQYPFSCMREKILLKNASLFCAYTSGTTGRPGAVMHRHADVRIMNQLYAKQILSVSENDILFTTSKMYFAYGLNCLFIALYHGGTAILSSGEFSENAVFSIFEYYHPTIFFSVPRNYKKLLKHDEESNKLYVPRKCVSAGETLDAQLYNDWFEKYSVKIIDGLGSTETLSTFISNVPGYSMAGCTGRVVNGFKCDIKDADGRSVPVGQHGVLWVKGETLSTEYMNNPESTEERFKNGWFKTCDIFFKDQNEYFYYVGRLNDLIYKNGVWVYPNKIETRINKLNGVSLSIVTGYKVKSGNVLIIALIEAEKNAELLEIARNVTEACSNEVFYKEEEINAVVFVDKLAKTYSGKIKRRAVLENVNPEFLDLLNEGFLISAFDNQSGVSINVD